MKLPSQPSSLRIRSHERRRPQHPKRPRVRYHGEHIAVRRKQDQSHRIVHSEYRKFLFVLNTE